MSYSNHIKQAEAWISNLTPQALYEEKNLTQVKEYSYYLIESIDEPSDRFIKAFEQVLSRLQPRTAEERSNFAVAYFWLLRLKVFFFTRLTPQDKDRFVAIELILALKQGIDAWQGLDRYFRTLAGVDAQAIGGLFAASLAKSNVAIGSSGTVAQYIGKFKLFLNKKYLTDTAPTSLDLITFVNSDDSIGRLDESVKVFLHAVLKIYSQLLAYQKVTVGMTTSEELGDDSAKILPTLSTSKPLQSFPRRSASSERITLSGEGQASVAPRILSQSSLANRPKMDLLKPEAAFPRAAAPSLSPPSPEQQRATLVSGGKLFGMSLSHAIANADQGVISERGNIRTGAGASPAGIGKGALAAKAGETAPVPKFLYPAAVQNAPRALGSSSAAAASPPRPSPPPGIIDLSKRPAMNIAAVATPEQLQRISLSDADGVKFEEKLSQIKQKLLDVAREYQLPVSKVAENFYRSPLYQLFITMGVAVMNDNASPDQKTAFEKVVGNHKAANKEYLSREQFLALSRLKKDLLDLEAKL